MADVSLSTLPIATPTTIATPGAAAAEGAADGTTPFASLLTTLADPAAPAGKTPPPPAGAAALAAAFAVPIVPADPGLPVSDIAQADADAEAPPHPDKSDPTAALTPDLSAFLALLAPPQTASIVVRAATPQGPSSDGANAAPRPVATVTTITTPPAAIAAPAAPDAAAPVPLDPTAGMEPTGEPATIAPDRMAQAFAAIRAMAARTPDTAAPASTVAFTASAAGSVNGTLAMAPANAASTPQPSSTPVAAAQPTAPAAAAPLVATPAPVTQAADPVQDMVAVQDAGAAPRPTAVLAVPAAVAGSRRADPAPAAAVARSAEMQPPAPARARKMPDTVRIGDVRTDVASTRIDVASAVATNAAPLADDPVARQLSIAQDGQWLDALAKDIAGAGNGKGQLNFRLDPDHLGSLTVQLTQTADGASVRLTASTEAARTILADAQPRLVAEARAQGLNLRDATIETRATASAPTPTASANPGFSGGTSGGRSDQGGASAQLQQQSQQQQSGQRQRAPDQPRQPANPAPRAATPARSGADLYA